MQNEKEHNFAFPFKEYFSLTLSTKNFLSFIYYLAMKQNQNIGEFSSQYPVQDLLSTYLEAYLEQNEIELAVCVAKSNGNFQFALSKAKIKEPKKKTELMNLKEILNNRLRSLNNFDEGKSTKLYESLVSNYNNFVRVFRQKNVDQILLSQTDKMVKNDFSEKVKDLIQNEKQIVNQEENTLEREIRKIIECLLPEIVNPEDVSKIILEKKNFSCIRERSDITDHKKNRFIQYINGLDKFKDFLNYKGQQIKVVQRKLKLELIELLIDLLPSWEVLTDVVEKIIENPMASFTSDERLSTKQIRDLHERLRKLEKLKSYRKIKNIPNFLEEKLRKDGEKIIQRIHEYEKVIPSEEQNLKEVIRTFKEKQLFKRPKYRELYLFIKKECLEYLDAKRKSGVCTLELKMELILKLRDYMEQIQVPYSLHDSIEKLAVEKKRKDILELGLTKKQKINLLDWLNKEFHNYYEKQYYCESMETKVRNALFDLIIELNLDLSYSQILQFVNEVLKNGNVKNTLASLEFRKGMRNQITKALQNCHIFNDYVMKSMIDIDQENRKIKRKFIYDILIPQNIGQLDPSVLFEVVKKYTEDPSFQAIKKFGLLTEKEKKSILKEIKDDKQFKQHIKKFQKLKSNALIKKIQNSFGRDLEKQDFAIVWPYMKIYGQIELDQQSGQPILDEGYVEYKQLKGCMSKEVKIAIKDFQKSDLFEEFLKSYPETISQYEKSLVVEIDEAINRELEEASEKKMNAFLKGLKSVEYDLQELDNGENLQGNYKAFFKAARNIDAIGQLHALKKAKQFTEVLIEKISFGSTIDQILERKNFDKYDEEEKLTVLKNLKEKGIDYLDEIQCFSKKDIDILREELPQNEEKVKSPKKEKAKIQKQVKQVKVKEKASPQKSPKKGKKALTVDQFKEQITKVIQQYGQLSNNYALWEKAGKMIEEYEEKNVILSEYKSFLENSKKRHCQILIENLKNDDDSNLYSLFTENYTENQGAFIEIMLLQSPEEKKQKFQASCSLKAMKAKKIYQELKDKDQQLSKFGEKVRKINSELQEIKKIA